MTKQCLKSVEKAKRSVAAALLLWVAVALPPGSTSAAATATVSDCSTCSLVYMPVVDAVTGTPFYNECLGRCQLGADAVLVPPIPDGTAVNAVEGGGTPGGGGSTGTSGGNGAYTDPVWELLPAPSNPQALEGVPLTTATVTRFSGEGYLYAGRPGFGAKGPPEESSTEGLTATAMAGSAASASSRNRRLSAGSTAGSDASYEPPDMTYFLRIAYDTGDMYIKTMSKDAVAKLLGEAGKPVSGLSNLGEPSIPEGEEGEVEEADEESRSGVASGGSGSAAREGSSSTAPSSSTSAGAQQQERVTLQLFGGNSQQGAGSSSAPTPAPTAANETGGGGSSRRALRGSWGMLDGGSGMSARRGLNSIIEDCPSCSGNGVCRCISGVDNRRQISARPRYPLTAVAQLLYRDRDGTLYSCSGSVIGSRSRTVLTAAHCVFDRASRSFYGGFTVTPGLYKSGRRGKPFGSLKVAYADVKAEFRSMGSLAYDTGLLALTESSPGGSLGVDYQCGYRSYRLATAGYPVDKPEDTLWRHVVSTQQDVCSGYPYKAIGFDVVSGQSGSPMYTRDSDKKFRVRFTISFAWYPGGNGAVAITPDTWVWMVSFMEQHRLGSIKSSVVT